MSLLLYIILLVIINLLFLPVLVVFTREVALCDIGTLFKTIRAKRHSLEDEFLQSTQEVSVCR